MHNNNTVYSVHLMSKVLAVKVTYTNASSCHPFGCDLRRVKFHLRLRGEEEQPQPLHLNLFLLLTIFDTTWSHNLRFSRMGRDCLNVLFYIQTRCCLQSLGWVGCCSHMAVPFKLLLESPSVCSLAVTCVFLLLILYLFPATIDFFRLPLLPP